MGSKNWGLALSLLLSLISASAALAEPAQVVLRLEGNTTMEELAKSVNDPSSPHFHKFYTNEEIRSLAGPSDKDYQSMIQQLASDKIEVVSESATHLYITVRGERSYFEKLDSNLKSTFHAVVNYFSNSIIKSVHGLERSVPRRPHLQFYPQDPSGQAASFKGLTPAQIQHAYGFDNIYNMGITGKGQEIAVATYGDFYLQDVLDYRSQQHISGGSVNKATFNGTPSLDVMSAVETQTDAEFSGMIAPGADIVVYTSATNGDTGEVQMFNAILDDGRAKIVNYSWGSCETEVSAQHRRAMESIYARAVAQGVNILVASGDTGSDCVGKGSTTADYPAVEPNIVAVGGTHLDFTNGSTSEWAWSLTRDPKTGESSGASGGGISTLIASPSYQSGLSSRYTQGRSYPDVSFNADPASGEATYVHFNPNSNSKTPPQTAAYVVMGGTSIAAPQWSGFMALVAEARNSQPLGQLNPIIYKVMSEGNTSQYFYDIVSGSNGAYSATQGWDAVTGIGSLKADLLLSLLKNQ